MYVKKRQYILTFVKNMIVEYIEEISNNKINLRT